MYEPDTDSVQKALEAFILSASGWRKIFAANGDEESRSPEIRPEDALLTALAAGTFARFVRSASGKERPAMLLATDTRPTGRAIAAAAAAGLRQEGAEILFPGVAAAPEIMAAARTQDAFVYISASHNPFYDNGIKIINGKSGLFISMPSRKTPEGSYRDIAHPLDTETRELFSSTILGAYDKALKEQQV